MSDVVEGRTFGTATEALLVVVEAAAVLIASSLFITNSIPHFSAAKERRKGEEDLQSKA